MYEEPPPPPAPKPEDGEYTWNNFTWVKVEPTFSTFEITKGEKHHHHIKEK